MEPPTRKAARFLLAALLLATGTFAFVSGQAFGSHDRRAHRHAEAAVGASMTIRGRLESLTHMARSWSPDEPDTPGLARLDERLEVQAPGDETSRGTLRAVDAAIANECRLARELRRPGVASSALAESGAGLVGVAPLPGGAGFLIDPGLAGGLPSAALSRSMRLHRAHPGGGPSLNFEPSARNGPLGRRSSLVSSSPALERVWIAALAMLGFGLLGWLSTRRRLEPEIVSEARRSAAETKTDSRRVANPPRDLTALERAPDPILIHRDGLVAWSNSAAARSLRRRSPFALLGSDMTDWLDDGQATRWQEYIDQLEAGTWAATHEFALRAEDGQTYDAQVRSAPVSFDGHASIESVFRIADRSTERPQPLRAGESYARHVLDALDDGVLVCDPTGAICDSNRGAEELLGYSSEVLRRLDLAGLCPSATKQELAQMRATLHEVVRGEQVDTIPVEIRCRRGQARLHTLTFRPAALPGRVVVILRRA